MIRKSMLFALAVAAVVALALPTLAGSDVTKLSARLTGDAEVPPVVTETTGKASFEVEGDRIHYTLKVARGVAALGAAGAHIHCAPAGTNGPVVAFLAGAIPGGIDGDLKIQATLDAGNIVNTACGATIEELAASLAAGSAYVNVHSSPNPGGVVRGQITPKGD